MRMPLRLLRLIPVAIIVLEIAGFIVVGNAIGVLATIGLVVAAAVAGVILLRAQGFEVMARMQAETAAGRVPAREIADGVVILVAAVLLIVLGFLTDIVGLLLFIPPLRDAAWRFLLPRMRANVAAFASVRRGSPPAGAAGPVIDLEAGDISAPRPDSPWGGSDGRS
ncbi:MAG: FxsA family protein [Bauldia sp.]|nr:FxsA family protein [Bauldia sp.]